MKEKFKAIVEGLVLLWAFYLFIGSILVVAMLGNGFLIIAYHPDYPELTSKFNLIPQVLNMAFMGGATGSLLSYMIRKARAKRNGIKTQND